MSNESNVIELARFRILDGAERLLVSERPRMIEALHRRFPGCLGAYLTKEDDGSWLDVIVWRSREEADEAARMITTIPECAAWFGHISESGGIRHVEVVDAWVPGRAGS
ncbi:antibiotic biosynthesis monooxygenase [Streptomyces hainanensis]|uniref:antibiotic biosynthesis monooxygenase n=1 Tax=Streptomyces hainanensis TaxID=402648 RepID=UPI00269EDAAA